MRETRITQASLFDNYSKHEFGLQLKLLSRVLDEHTEVLTLIGKDLIEPSAKKVGRNGLSVESIFRCLLLKQQLGVSYEQLSFHLSDSMTYRTFARLPDKVNLSTEKNGFITRFSIEKGNPADKGLYLPVLEKHVENYNKLPKSVVCDGGYASKQNVNDGRQMGLTHAVFHKRVGISLQDMGVKSKTFKMLRNFRAGVEGNISELKRAFSLGKAKWKGHDGFKAFVWSSVLSYNLVRMARQQSG